jgi:hypothetical protein
MLTYADRNSAPVKLRTGDLAYIKTDLCKKVMGEALLPLVELHDKVLSLLALLVQKYKFCTPLRESYG